eukprot:c12078_g2_i1.p1 GENE.c12078_g2_i1~~c12078_g2_i1.p1  ORF type:complete len:2023 (-),score=567.46 c12078_g2_i1:24-6035(-)
MFHEARGSGPRRALVIVCVQNDFCAKGTLQVSSHANQTLIDKINSLRNEVHWDLVALTYDWHPLNHCSFWQNHPGFREGRTIQLDNRPQIMWPQHCVQGTRGSQLHPGLEYKHDDIHIFAGVNPRADSYSAFMDKSFGTEQSQSLLFAYLKRNHIDEVYCCGLASDVCVQYTLIDASSPETDETTRTPFRTFFVPEASQAFSQVGLQAALTNLRIHNVTVISDEALRQQPDTQPHALHGFFPTESVDHDTQHLIRVLLSSEEIDADTRAMFVKGLSGDPARGVQCSSKTGRSLLHELCRLSPSRLTPPHHKFLLEVVSVILKAPGAAAHHDEVAFWTPMMMACGANSPDVLQLIIQHLDCSERSVQLRDDWFIEPVDQDDESILRLLFLQIDVHRTGLISRQGLREYLEINNSLALSPDMVTEIMASLDADGDDLIDVEEFTQSIVLRQMWRRKRVLESRQSIAVLQPVVTPLHASLAAQETLLGMTALMVATQHRHTACFSVLLEACDIAMRAESLQQSEPLPFVLRHADKFGRTALHYACECVDPTNEQDITFLDHVLVTYHKHLHSYSTQAWMLFLKLDRERWTFLHYLARKNMHVTLGVVVGIIRGVFTNPAAGDMEFREWLHSHLVRILLDPVVRGFNILHLVAWNQHTESLTPLLILLDLIQAVQIASDVLTTWGWSVLDLALFASFHSDTSEPPHPSAIGGKFHTFQPDCSLTLARAGFVPRRTLTALHKDTAPLSYLLLLTAFLSGEDNNNKHGDIRDVIIPLLCKPEYGIKISEAFVAIVDAVRHHRWCTEKSILSAGEVRGTLIQQPVFGCAASPEIRMCVVCAINFGRPVQFLGILQESCNLQRLVRLRNNTSSQQLATSPKLRSDSMLIVLNDTQLDSNSNTQPDSNSNTITQPFAEDSSLALLGFSQLGSASPMSKRFKDDVVRASLVCASRNGNDRLIKQLLTITRGTFPQLRHQPFATPLHAAVMFGHTKTVRTLLRYNEASFQSFLALQVPLVLRTDTATHRSPLHVAAAQGNKDICNILLKFTMEQDRLALLTMRDYKNLTPLHLAVLSTSVETVEYLCGEILNSPDIRGVNELYGFAASIDQRKRELIESVAIVFRKLAGNAMHNTDSPRATEAEAANLPVLRRDAQAPSSDLKLVDSFVINRFTRLPHNYHPHKANAFIPDFYHYGLHIVQSPASWGKVRRWELIAPSLNRMWTPLHLAVWTNQPRITQILLDFRANPTWRPPLAITVYEEMDHGELRVVCRGYHAWMPSALDLAIGEMRCRRKHLEYLEDKRDSSWRNDMDMLSRSNFLIRCLTPLLALVKPRFTTASQLAPMLDMDNDTDIEMTDINTKKFSKQQRQPTSSKSAQAAFLSSASRLPSIMARQRRKKHTTEAEEFHLAHTKEGLATDMLTTMYKSKFVQHRVGYQASTLFIKQAMLYLLYLVGFMVIAFPDFNYLVSNDAYTLNAVVQTNFVNRLSDVVGTNGDWNTVWNCLQSNLPIFDTLGVYGNTHLIGAVRLRQVRHIENSPDNCVRAGEIQHWRRSCLSDQKDSRDYTSNFTYGGAWSELSGADWHSFDSSGYVVDIPSYNVTKATALLATMQQEAWLDSSTRALFIDYTMYNPTLNMFCVTRALAIRTYAGALQTSNYVNTVSLLNNDRKFDLRMPSDIVKGILFVLLIGILSAELLGLLSKGARKYIQHWWNVYDLCIGVVVIGVLYLDFRVSTRMESMGKIDLTKDDVYLNFVDPAWWLAMERNIISILVLACFVRLLKYLRTAPLVGPTIIAIVETMIHPSVLIFGLVLFVFILAFAFAFTVAIGWSFHDTQSAVMSFFTLYTIELGINNNNNVQFNAVTYFLFIVFTIFNILVLFNLLIAVICEVYPQRKRASEETWRKKVFQSMEAGLPKARQYLLTHAKFHSFGRIVHHMFMFPEAWLGSLFARLTKTYPHDWKYGDYTEQVNMDDDVKDDDDDDDEDGDGNAERDATMDNVNVTIDGRQTSLAKLLSSLA